jgi:LmbE family N-acetylglucosaminyl deacetylase
VTSAAGGRPKCQGRARLAALGGSLLLAAAGHAASGRTPPPLALMTVPTAADRVLVIAPHPDDETLCCAGYLQRAAQAGAAVGVVWITAGDSFEIDAMVTERTLRPRGASLEKLGLRRIIEGRAAADLLGVPRAYQYLLGFPDRDLSVLLQSPKSTPLRSRYTGVSAVPYADAMHPGSAYTGANLSSELQQVITAFAPTVVLAAAPMDRHPDHRASGSLALELLAASAPRARLYYWIVHAGHKWPAPRGLHRELPLQPPASAQTLAWQQLPLTDAQVAGKLRALQQHATQLKVMSRFLNAFVRADEIYAPPP